MTTKERGLILPVGPLAVAAPGARPAGVAWVDDLDRDAGKGRLVFKERAQLPERPARMPRPFRPANRGPRADALEILQSEPTPGVFAGRNEALGDAVVLVTPEARFVSGEATQPLLRALGTDLLEPLTQAVVPAADRLDGRATMLTAVRIDREIGDAKIDAEEVGDLDGWLRRQIDARVEEERPVLVDEIALALNPIKARSLVFAEHERDDLSPLQRQQAHPVHPLEAHQAFVVSHRAARFEDRAPCLVAPEDLDGLADGAHGHLRRQAEAVAQLSIAAVVNRGLAEHFRLEPDPRGMRRCRVEARHSGQEQAPLSGVGEQPELESQRHIASLGQTHSVCQSRTATLSPALKHGIPAPHEIL